MDDPEIAFPCDPRVSGRNFHDTTFPNPPVSDEGKGESVIGVSIPLFPSTPAPPPHPPPPTSQTPGVTTSRVLISTPLPLFPFHPHSFLLSPEEENSSTPLPYFPFYPISFIPFSPHRPPLLHKKRETEGVCGAVCGARLRELRLSQCQTVPVIPEYFEKDLHDWL